MSAQPAMDRSLTADQTAAEPATNAVTVTAIDLNAPGAATNAPTTGATNPDLSGLTREQLEAKVKSLTDDLAAANLESETFRTQWTELKLRDEALGVDALTVDESKTEDKVVQAVKELYQSEMKRREALVLLAKLLNSTDELLRTAPNYDPRVRGEYEVASLSAKEYLSGHSGASIPMAISIGDGRIADVSQDLNAVILNLGREQGVKEGMVFTVFQNTVAVGALKIVLARDLVSAAQVQNLKPKTVLRIGDRVAVEP